MLSHGVSSYQLIEPSAGNGSFLFDGVDGYDLHPEHTAVVQNDFLCDQSTSALMRTYKNPIFIGNPPFGVKSKLVIDFIKQALKYWKYAGFIVPVQLRKFLTQNRLPANFRLILDDDLPEDSFTFCGKDYAIRCCFQVWTTTDNGEDLRIRTKPSTTHADFRIEQHNATNASVHLLSSNFSFATYRQGYHDYNQLLHSTDELNPKRQYVFFYTSDSDVLSRLKSIDFTKLAMRNTSTPGFGKADLVAEYVRLWG